MSHDRISINWFYYLFILKQSGFWNQTISYAAVTKKIFFFYYNHWIFFFLQLISVMFLLFSGFWSASPRKYFLKSCGAIVNACSFFGFLF